MIPKGTRVRVRGHHSERGKGLSYMGFIGTLLEDCTGDSWDVVDVQARNGVQSVYSFSVGRALNDNPKRELTVPEKHQLRIARDTLKMHPAARGVMGGPTEEEARAIILRLTGRPYKENPRVSHAEVKRGLLGGRRTSRGPVKIGGYPDKGGNVLTGQGKATGWRIEYSVHVYRLPDVLSWMTRTAEAVVLCKGKRKAVALSYGTGMILRGVEVLGPVSDDDLTSEAKAEAEHWLSIDISDAEEQEEREQEAEE